MRRMAWQKENNNIHIPHPTPHRLRSGPLGNLEMNKIKMMKISFKLPSDFWSLSCGRSEIEWLEGDKNTTFNYINDEVGNR